MLDKTATIDLAKGTSYFGPFETILVEADQFRNVTERLAAIRPQSYLSSGGDGIERMYATTAFLVAGFMLVGGMLPFFICVL